MCFFLMHGYHFRLLVCLLSLFRVKRNLVRERRMVAREFQIVSGESRCGKGGECGKTGNEGCSDSSGFHNNLRKVRLATPKGTSHHAVRWCAQRLRYLPIRGDGLFGFAACSIQLYCSYRSASLNAAAVLAGRSQHRAV